MKFLKNGKWNIFKFSLLFTSISLLGFCSLILYNSSILDQDTEGLVLVEYINSGVQRISKLELENSGDLSLLTELKNISVALYSPDATSKYFAKNEELQQLVHFFVNDIYVFSNAIDDFRANGDRNLLFLASETNYNNSEDVIKSINLYTTKLSKYIFQLEIYAILNLVIIILILIKIILDTNNELNKNKELSKDMFIDTSTGLYNRSKCQEILKATTDASNKKRACNSYFRP